MKKMTILYKISFSALFIALGVILSRFFALPYLFGLPFLKISLAVSVILFSSFYLGPLFGTIVGFSVDFFGAILFPQGGSYDPLYSIPALLEGLAPCLIYLAITKLKLDKKKPILLGILILLFNIIVLVFVLTHDTFSYTATSKKYEFTPFLKAFIPSLFVVLGILFLIAIIVLKNKFANKKLNQYYNIYAIASSVFLTYFLIKIPISSLIFMYRLEYTYEIIFGVRSLTGFLTCLVHTFMCLLALDVSLKAGTKGYLVKELVLENRTEEEVKNESKN